MCPADACPLRRRRGGDRVLPLRDRGGDRRFRQLDLALGRDGLAVARPAAGCRQRVLRRGKRVPGRALLRLGLGQLLLFLRARLDRVVAGRLVPGSDRLLGARVEGVVYWTGRESEAGQGPLQLPDVGAARTEPERPVHRELAREQKHRAPGHLDRDGARLEVGADGGDAAGHHPPAAGHILLADIGVDEQVGRRRIPHVAADDDGVGEGPPFDRGRDVLRPLRPDVPGGLGRRSDAAAGHPADGAAQRRGADEQQEQAAAASHGGQPADRLLLIQPDRPLIIQRLIVIQQLIIRRMIIRGRVTACSASPEPHGSSCNSRPTMAFAFECAPTLLCPAPVRRPDGSCPGCGGMDRDVSPYRCRQWR
jgi:hypothetical protein